MSAPASAVMQKFAMWWSLADSDGDGRLTGQDAVAFFGRSGLDRKALSRVWALSDSRGAGFLDYEGFVRAMKLISMAQSGLELSLSNLQEQETMGALSAPLMEGLDAVQQGPPQGSDNPFEASGYMANMAPAPPAASPQPAPSKPRRKGDQRMDMRTVTSLVDGLKRIYAEKAKAIEQLYKFDSFYAPLLGDSDFDAKPSVLLLGQYSTGKTTFIKHLLGREYPGAHVGPEPTTDRFVVVMHGHEEKRTPGNTLAVQKDRPFTGLTAFGTAFLSKFEGAQCDCRLLEEVTLVDTPGVLSGEKQRIDRSYAFIDVCRWFAGRCDLILLLFDPHKLDISDEFKEVISSLKGHEDKVRIVLNKADMVTQDQLMRVYGALMFSLGKVLKTPEVPRVYLGSFNEPGKGINAELNPGGVQFFEREQAGLMKDLLDIPARSCDRKVNELVKRLRYARIHTLIIAHLRKQMPTMMGKAKKQEQLLANLEQEFEKVMHEHRLPKGDFPGCAGFREILKSFDLSKFPKPDKKTEGVLTDVLENDIPALLKHFDNPYGDM